jgi:hypothetical protein
VRLLLRGALALDLALIAAAAAGGLSWDLGPVRISVRDFSNPLVLALILTTALLALDWRDPRRRAWALAAVPLIVGCAGIALARGGTRIFPVADIAIIELYARNVLTGKLLVGPYSRFGWHHPGPMYFYLIAPFYALGGQHPAALAAGAAVLASGAAALVAWASARFFGSAVAVALTGVVALLLWRLPEIATSPWNPHVVLVPTIALIVLCAALTAGRPKLLPIVLFVSSFLVQTDVALVPVVVAVVGTASVWGVARGWAGSIEPARPAALAAVWVVVGAWFLPAAEQAVHSPGNLTRLWRFFVESPAAGQPFDVAALAWARWLAAPLRPGLSFAATGSPAGSLGVAAAQLLALAAVAAWGRRAHRALASLALLALVASLVALWSATRIQDRVMDHQLFWLTSLAVLNLGIVAAAAALYLQAVLPRWSWPGRLVPFACAALIGVTLLMCFRQLERAREGALPVTRSSPVAERLGTAVREHLTSNGLRKPLITIAEGEEIWGMAAAMLLELDRLGVPFAVEESWMPMFPNAFAASGEEDAEVAVSDRGTHEQLSSRLGSVAVADTGTVFVDAIRIAPEGAR